MLWRQGHVLKNNNAIKLGLTTLKEENVALIISHDCDLIKDGDKEPKVELIIGDLIPNIDGNCTFGKNPRTLHLVIESQENPMVIALPALQKYTIEKAKLLANHPDNIFSIGPKNLAILQGWLAARYKRAAFPNSFIDRIEPLRQLLEKEGKKMADKIIGYWFSVDPLDEELPIDQPYELSISIIYTIDDPSAEKAVQYFALELENKVNLYMQKTCHLGRIILKKCEAYSEQEFTLYDMRTQIQYRFEHLSHRIDPQGEIIE